MALLPREQAIVGKYASSRVVSKLDTIEQRLLRVEKILVDLVAILEEKENKNKKSVDK